MNAVDKRVACRSGRGAGWRGAALGLLLAALTGGCAGYRLGPTNGMPAGSRTVRVKVLSNQTEEPRLIEAVTAALRKRFQQDGTFKLATHGEADVVVSGVITRFERSPFSFQPRDVVTAQDMWTVIHARITADEPATGRKLLDTEVAGRTTVRVGPDLPSAERQALPLLAEDLARNAVSLLVDGSW